jgi:hypothetical protein
MISIGDLVKPTAFFLSKHYVRGTDYPTRACGIVYKIYHRTKEDLENSSRTAPVVFHIFWNNRQCGIIEPEHLECIQVLQK